MSDNLRSISLMAGILLVVWSLPSVAAERENQADAEALLQVHLPREVTVRGNNLDLGQITVIRGQGPVVAEVRKIGMGRLSVPGQKVVLNRATILSRLASSGISGDQIRLTGAEAVTVRRQQRVVEAEDFVQIARDFLEKHPSARSVHEIVPIARPKDLILSQDVKDIQFTPRFVASNAPGHASVQVDVAVDGAGVETRSVTFRLKYESRQTVTLEAIPAGTVLTAENVKVEKTLSDRPDPVGWKPPYGLTATRSLPANTVIRNGMVETPQPPVVVRRNEIVLIRLERPGLLITATGTALQQARTGEFIKVRNTDSRRVITCKVVAAGTVEPML